jgi:hypothetical protein
MQLAVFAIHLAVDRFAAKSQLQLASPGRGKPIVLSPTHLQPRIITIIHENRAGSVRPRRQQLEPNRRPMIRDIIISDGDSFLGE